MKKPNSNSLLIKLGFLVFCCPLSTIAQWQFLGSPESCKSVSFDSEGDTILLLTSAGLYYSLDDAAHWQPIPGPDTAYLFESIQIEKGSLYLSATHTFQAPNFNYTKHDIYRSDDWGQHWTVLTDDFDVRNGFIQFLVKADTFYYIDTSTIHVSYNRGDQFTSQFHHFGFYSNYYINNHHLYGKKNLDDYQLLNISYDDGATWLQIYASFSGNYIKDVQSINGVLWKVEHHPNWHMAFIDKSYDDGYTWINTGTLDDIQHGFFDTEPQKIFGDTTNLFIFTESNGDYLYHSVDGGYSWPKRTLNSKEPWYVNSNLFFTSVLGFYGSNDYGLTYDTLQTGLTAASIMNIAVSDNSIWSNAQHLEFIKPSLNSNWQSLPSFTDVAATQDGYLLSLIDDEAYYSLDHGENWTLITDEDLNQELPYPIIRIMCAGNVMYLANGGSDMFYSVDHGLTWHTSELTLGYELAFNGKYLINAGTHLYDVYTSENGKDWTLLPYPTNPELLFFIEWLTWIDPYYYLAANSLVLRLHKDSTEWKAVSIPEGHTTTNNDATLLGAGKNLFLTVFGLGVFQSTDFGANWFPINDGLTNLKVLNLSIFQDELYLGVEGGVWKRPLSELTVAVQDPSSESCYFIYPTVFQDKINIKIDHIIDQSATIQLISSDGKILKQEKMGEPMHEINTETLPSGLYFLRVFSPEYGMVKQIVKM